MAHKIKVGLEFPAIDNDLVRVECLDFTDQCRIDDTLEMMGSRFGGSVLHKGMVIARKQVDIPFPFNAKVLVDDLSLCLPPGIKYFYPKISRASQMTEQRGVVLNRVG